MLPRPNRLARAALAVALALGALAAPLVVRPAGATAPCFHVCHLGQGQPLLLTDTDQLWVRRCTTAKPGAPEVCVLERVASDGRALQQVPRERSYDEHAFEAAHLRGRTVVQLNHQTPWTDLTKPYLLQPYHAPGVTLRFDGDALVCAAAPTPTGAPRAAPAKGPAPPVRRPLGCTPRSVYVFAASVGRNGQPEDPTGLVAVVATCADGAGTREAVAICRPPR